MVYFFPLYKFFLTHWGYELVLLYKIRIELIVRLALLAGHQSYHIVCYENPYFFEWITQC